MSIEVPVLEVFDLADRLRSIAEHGRDADARLRTPAAVGAVAVALEDFIACFGLAARALAEEAELLGGTAETAARSWIALDDGLLARRRQLLDR